MEKLCRPERVIRTARKSRAECEMFNNFGEGFFLFQTIITFRYTWSRRSQSFFYFTCQCHNIVSLIARYKCKPDWLLKTIVTYQDKLWTENQKRYSPAKANVAWTGNYFASHNASCLPVPWHSILFADFMVVTQRGCGTRPWAIESLRFLEERITFYLNAK